MRGETQGALKRRALGRRRRRCVDVLSGRRRKGRGVRVRNASETSGEAQRGFGGEEREEVVRKTDEEEGVGVGDGDVAPLAAESSGSRGPADDFSETAEMMSTTKMMASTSTPAVVARGAEEASSSSSGIKDFFFPDESELPDEVYMPLADHLEELRERLFLSVIAVLASAGGCFVLAKDIVLLLERPVFAQGVRFLQLSPGEFFFTTLKVAGYSGLLMAFPIVAYEVAAYVAPGLTVKEKQFVGPLVAGSSVLFYLGIVFSYVVLAPAALTFFVTYAFGAVESLWSIDQYFDFVLVLLFSTGLAFQVPVLQVLLGRFNVVNSKQMLSAWRYVTVGATIAAAVLTPSTDPFTQSLLAVPLIGLYMAGTALVYLIEKSRPSDTAADITLQ